MSYVSCTQRVEPSHSATPEFDERRAPRQQCDWPAQCIVSGHDAIDIRIINVSKGGFGVSTALPARQNDVVTLNIEDIGIFRCRVAWVSTERSGLEIIVDNDDLSGTRIDALAGCLSHMS